MKKSIAQMFATIFYLLPRALFEWLFADIWIKENQKIKNRICKKIIAFVLENSSIRQNERLNQRLWQGEAGVRWHKRLSNMYASVGFEKYRKSFIQRLLDITIERGFQCVVEIGCGNGLTIKKMESALNALKKDNYICYGFDLNYIPFDSTNSIIFEIGGFEKLNKFNDDRVIIFVIAVLTCLNSEELISMVRQIETLKSGSVFAFCEPVIFRNNEIIKGNRSEVAYSHLYENVFSTSFDLLFKVFHFEENFVEFYFIKK